MSKENENSEDKLSVWVKKNGTEMKLNNHSATIAHAKEMGWKRKGEKKAPAKKEGKADKKPAEKKD